MAEGRPYRYQRWRVGPSMFFPAALITLGIIWLLVNSGMAETENVFRLVVFWPVLLVAAGVSVILRQISWLLSALVWLGLGAVTVWAVLNPPASLPGYRVPEYQHREIEEPLGDAKKASINLDLSLNPTEIFSLTNDDNLFEADLFYLGGLSYRASGSGDQMTIRLGESFSQRLFDLPAAVYESRDQPWKIGLTPRIPLAVTINGGVGAADIDLSALQLTSLQVDGGTGSTTVKLPEDSAFYKFRLEVGTGRVTIDAPSGSTLDMEVRGGVGKVELFLPADSGVQVTVRNGGIGSLDLPDAYRQVRKGKDSKEGVWENETYRKDETPIRVELDIGVGSVVIR